MQSPSTEDMLNAWERCVSKGPVERGVILAGLAASSTAEDALALPIGERDRRLLALRMALLGSHLTGLVTCEGCGVELELEVAIKEICGSAPLTGELMMASDNYMVWLRLPDSHDLLAAVTSPAEASRLLLQRCVVRAELDGVPITADALPAPLIAQVGSALSEADPLADLHFAITCSDCGHACQKLFDTAGFVWAELDAWAGRIQREVHVLAGAYGWSESDILRLGPARRARYLRMVEG
jgi:hypothetical protein